MNATETRRRHWDSGSGIRRIVEVELEVECWRAWLVVVVEWRSSAKRDELAVLVNNQHHDNTECRKSCQFT